jgi:hypothetical protein
MVIIIQLSTTATLTRATTICTRNVMTSGLREIKQMELFTKSQNFLPEEF